MKLIWRTGIGLALAAAMGMLAAPAQSPALLQPRQAQDELRSWGDGAMAGVMRAWQEDFSRAHPEVRFRDTLLGSGTGMAGIITGVSQLSVMGRQATANEVMGFEWVFRYKPRGFEVLTGSMATPEASPALVVFVHRSNPLSQLSFEQLRRLLGCCQGEGKIERWGQLGLSGAWKDKIIHAYLYDNETGTGLFLQQALLGSADKWDWERVREFRDIRSSERVVNSAEAQIMAAFARDPYGIAIATLHDAGNDARPVALSERQAGPYFLPTAASVTSRDYPLARAVLLYVNAPPDKPLEPLTAEFLRFVLSPEGQAIAARAGTFLPLPDFIAEKEREELSH